ncbi:helix-turn-helix domain-containing protein [Flavobacterium kingsejongi]|uniref:Transcriptional regulator n=1 Tax=Flavobacterium kingsejongi TaxID=1678728 RepID=A0A2S1LQW2_9FLAO|nr:helix-turn-helix transcriptional regulator [Flavobacterium kingsejongi]AWG26160.1 transcriptional regulator [Flavobacterium kingsejongi]
MSTTTPINHIGRKISRIREIKGIKQEALAIGLGITQQAISKLERSAKIDDEKLEEVAKILGVTSEEIKNFAEENTTNYFTEITNNSFTDNDLNESGIFLGSDLTTTFNPLDKLIEIQEENKNLYERLLALEQQLLKAEQDKVAYLEKLLKL